MLNQNLRALAVEASHLSFSYSSQTKAVDHVSLSVRSGALCALLGQNGSGKSTLLKLISTLITPSSGTLSLFGEDALKKPLNVRHFLGVVFQKPSVDIHLTVRENFQGQGRLYGLSHAVIQERILELTQTFQLTERLDERVKTLSGGLIRRLDVAKALLHNPRLLLLDEPSSGLDRESFNALWTLLKNRVSQTQMTVVIATHVEQEATMCEQIVRLAHGQIATS